MALRQPSARRSPTASASTVIVLLIAAVSVGCASHFDADLLTLKGVAPERVEPDVWVSIRGSDFPVGRSATVRFDGVLHRPGAPAVPSHVRVAGRAVAPGRIAFLATDRFVAAVGGRGTFEGDVRVAFAAAEAGGAVSGVLHHVGVDVSPDTATRLANEIDGARRAEAILARLGIALEEGEGLDGGLLAHSVRRGSAGAAAGLRPGDRIETLDGVDVHSVADLEPSPDARSVHLTVARDGEAGDVPLVVSLGAVREAEVPTVPWTILLPAVLLLSVLLLMAPSARLTAGWLDRIAAPRGPPSSNKARASRDPLLETASLVAATAALAAMPWATRLLPRGLDVGAILLVALVSNATVVLTSLEPGRRLPRPSVLLRALAHASPALAAVVCVAVFAGTVSVSGIVEAQGPWPFRWLAFEDPIVFLLVPAFVVTVLGARRVSAEGASTAITEVFERAHLLVMSGLGAALFFGGWRIPGGPVEPLGAGSLAAAAATALFVVKGGALLAAGLWMRRRGAAERAWRWALPLSLPCAVGAVLALRLDIPPAVDAVCGPLLASLAVLLLVAVLAARPGRARPRVQPFL